MFLGFLLIYLSYFAKLSTLIMLTAHALFLAGMLITFFIFLPTSSLHLYRARDFLF